jgi:hypothetical protein
MHKNKSASGWVLISLLAICSHFACKKDQKIYTPVPFLTGRTWVTDTMMINPPLTFNQLSAADQQYYRSAAGWFHNGRLSFNEDGTVTCGGDYDLGFKTWRLINNNSDIEVYDVLNNKHILRSWLADAVHLAYTIQMNNSFDCSVFYK